MAETFVNLTEGAGKKLWGFDWTVGANTVISEAVHPAPYPYPTYVALGGTISLATINDHVLCLNGSAGLKTRILRIHIEQSSHATAVALGTFSIFRTTTAAPTGGTAVTPRPYETGDAAASAAARTLPTAKGTEAAELFRIHMPLRQALLATSAQMDDVWDWEKHGDGKPIIIPTGATNGVVVKNNSAVAGAAVDVWMEFVETAF